MPKKMLSLILYLTMVPVAFIALPFSASTNGGVSPTVRIEPETLNLASHGVFTAFITLPEGYDGVDIY